MSALATVDLVRIQNVKTSRWHVAKTDTVTLCDHAIPETATWERGLDSHVVAYRGVAVCSICRRRLA